MFSPFTKIGKNKFRWIFSICRYTWDKSAYTKR